MNEQEFLDRTRAFGLRVIRLVRALPKNDVNKVLVQQLLRSGTSVGANYRAACRARSRTDVIAKLKIAEEEVDESSYWMELLCESGGMPRRRLSNLLEEANELTAMLVASIKTLRSAGVSTKS